MDVVMVLPKRRPGRPRKIKMEFADEEELPFNYLMKVVDDEDMEVETTFAEAASYEFDEVDVKKSALTEAVIVEVPKKKRGRPPLHVNKRASLKSESGIKKFKQSNSSTDDEDYTPFQTNTKLKRRVGRSPKSAQKNDKLLTQSPQIGAVQKRGPGRPRKNPLPTVEFNESTSDAYSAQVAGMQTKRIIRPPNKLLNGEYAMHSNYTSIEKARSTASRSFKEELSSYEEEIDDDDEEWKSKDVDDEYDYEEYDGDEWNAPKKQKPGATQSRMKKAKKLKTRKKKEEEDDINSDDEISRCVPNGFKLIECLLCGERMQKIHILRQHIQLHAQGEDIDDKILERAPIYEFLNPHKRDIDTPVMREFIMKEIRGQRTSELYVILSEAEQELHLSDSETDSVSGEFDEDVINGIKSKKIIPRNIYKCELCEDGVSFRRRYKANFHHRTVHRDVKELPVKCYICGKGFIGAQLLSHHLKTQCERDNKPFPLIQRFWRHLAKANLEQMKNMSQARKALRPQPIGHIPRDYECDICHLRFVRPEHMVRHKRIHAPDALKFKCPRCPNRFFSRKDNLKLHMQVHLDATQRTIKEKKILCAECGRSFNRHSNWVIHNRRHHTKEKPYPCKICGKCFVCSTDMKSHEQTHSNIRKHVCNICGKSFGRANLLSKHMTIHDGTLNADDSLQNTVDQPALEEEFDDVTSVSESGHIEADELEEEEVSHIIKSIEIEYLE